VPVKTRESVHPRSLTELVVPCAQVARCYRLPVSPRDPTMTEPTIHDDHLI
jgi:hypothetical protein